MTVNFKLLRPKDKTGKLRTEPVSIQIVVCNKQSRVELSTGLKVVPKFWGKGEVKIACTEYQTINDDLDAIKKRVETSWKQDRAAVGETLKRLVEKAIIGSADQPIQKKTVEPWIQNFITESKRKRSTKQVYSSSLNHLKDFAEKRNLVLTWEAFDLDFYEDFTGYLYSIGHEDNTVGKVIKTLKTFITQAFERGLHNNLNFKKRGFKVLSAEVEEIYLTENEIEQFHRAEVPVELLDIQKKFVFGCYVGLRYGDLSKLGPNNYVKTFNGDFIKITATKTGEDVVIPFHPIAKEIWDSWKGVVPKHSNPEFNAQIKIIAEKAGLKEMVPSKTTIKGVVKTEWLPKCQMVKAHTMRRSFATNCALEGIPKQTIMSVTGHKTEKSFMKYVKITKVEHAGIMAGFFNKTEQTVMKKAN
jgi:integrase